MSLFHEKLGLPSDAVFDPRVMIEVLQRFRKYQRTDCDISMISFMYYVDNHGNFNKKIDKWSKVVKAMFNNLPIDEKMAITFYILENK